MLVRIAVPRTLLVLASALSCLRGLDTLPLPRFQIECVFLDVLDDFLIHHFSLKALECAFQAFAIIYVNFSQQHSPRIRTLKRNSFPQHLLPPVMNYYRRYRLTYVQYHIWR